MTLVMVLRMILSYFHPSLYGTSYCIYHEKITVGSDAIGSNLPHDVARPHHA